MGSVNEVAGEPAGTGGLRIGITGHRPDRLAAASLPGLRARLAEVLDALSGVRGGAVPPSVVVSSLAEGADRLVAETAIARGDRLVAVLPFARAEFARDFATAASRSEYAALLDLAAETIELPGARGADATDAAAAYAAASAAVLARSDVLLAIWDGEAGRGIGGTAHTVDAAVARGIPVVWVGAGPPHAVRVLGAGARGGAVATGLAALAARFDQERRP